MIPPANSRSCVLSAVPHCCTSQDTCRYEDIRLEANARSNIEGGLVAKHLEILSSGDMLVLRVVEASFHEGCPVEGSRRMEAIQLEILEKIAVQCWACYTGGFDLSGCTCWWWRSCKLFEGRVEGQEDCHRVVYGVSQLLGGS